MKKRLRKKFYKKCEKVFGHPLPWLVHDGPTNCPSFYDGCWCIPKKNAFKILNKMVKEKEAYEKSKVADAKAASAQK